MSADNDRYLEMISEMCEAYVDNFRGSTFFTDYTLEECQALVDYADQKHRTSKNETTAVVWAGISQLAAGCLDDFEAMTLVEADDDR